MQEFKRCCSKKPKRTDLADKAAPKRTYLSLKSRNILKQLGIQTEMHFYPRNYTVTRQFGDSTLDFTTTHTANKVTSRATASQHVASEDRF